MSFFTIAELPVGFERSSRKPNVLRRIDMLTRVALFHSSVNRRVCKHYAMQHAAACSGYVN